MSDKTSNPTGHPSPWPHRLAWVLVCATFPLICWGGLVTTYDAGMAVPDWPSTYGYWLYYPVKAWLAVWDLFLEHGHRMLAQLVGLVTIALAVVLWRVERRRWMRWLGVAAVVGVVFQGTLGGLRVIADERLLAMVHGCTAPLFFALCAALVTLTSRRWIDLRSSDLLQRGTVPFSLRENRDSPRRENRDSPLRENRDSPRRENRDSPQAARRLRRLSLAVTLALYVQIVLGAQLRHVSPNGGIGWFELWVWLKLIAAGLITIGVVWLLIHVRRNVPEVPRIVRRAKLLSALFFVQLVLGAATWVTNFGWPAWFTNYIWAVEYTVVAEGWLQVVMTTAHAALGSLNLVGSLSLTLWSRRLLRGGPPTKGSR